MKNDDFRNLPKSTKRLLIGWLAFCLFLLVQLLALVVAVFIKVVF